MFSWFSGATDTSDSHSHSLRGAAMLLSVEEVLLAAVLVLWPCAAWPAFWLWAGWFWPAWTGFCVWLGLFGWLEVSMLLPMLLPSCSRLMCRTTAVALNACWRGTTVKKHRAFTLLQFLCIKHSIWTASCWRCVSLVQKGCFDVTQQWGVQTKWMSVRKRWEGAELFKNVWWFYHQGFTSTNGMRLPHYQCTVSWAEVG